MDTWLLAVEGIVILVPSIALVCWIRVHSKRGSGDDRLAGKTPEEKRRNWKLMTTLVWATLVPMLLVFPLLWELGFHIAVSHGIETEGADANVWYALGYMFLVTLPGTGLAGVLGRRLWKRVLLKHHDEKLLKAFLDDPWWKRAGD
jgi:hypothetical protein